MSVRHVSPHADDGSGPRALRGSLAVIHLPDLLNLLGSSHKTGRLTTGADPKLRVIFFADGQITFVRSEATLRLLGGLLLREKLIPPEAWADLSCVENEESIGLRLLHDQGIAPVKLAELFKELIIEEITRLLTPDHSPFIFEEGIMFSSGPVEISLPVDLVLLQAVHRKDEREYGRISPDGLLAEMRPMLGKLVQIEGEHVRREITLKMGTTTLGSESAADVIIDASHYIAPVQLRICLTGRRYFLDDLEGAGRVRVNGFAVERQALEDGDEITVGPARFLFHRMMG